MNSFAYYNGKFGKADEVKIPLSDRAIYFGDGVYDAAIGYRGEVFLGDEHIRRFLGNAKKLGITHSYTKESIAKILGDVAMRAGLESFFIYFQLSRNADGRTHSYASCDGVDLLIRIDPFVLSDVTLPLSLVTYDDLRYFYCDIKTLNLLPSVMAASYADSLGCDEAVFHRNGNVTECSHSNISLLKNGILKTHPANNLILPGITRKHLLSACTNLGIDYIEEPFSLDELFSADEILVTSTTKLCRRANRIDGVSVGGRDCEKFMKICRYMEKEYLDFCKSV